MGKYKLELKRETLCGLAILALAASAGMPSASAQETVGEGTTNEKAVSEKEPGFWRKSFQPIQYFTNLTADANRFNDVELIARKPGATQANLTTYAQAGITLSDSACTGWLQTLAYSERNSNFFKDILNIVGNVILGVAGVNGANPASLAKGSLGLAAGNATIEAYQNEVILGTISDIQAKLEEGRRTSAAYFVQHVPDNYDETKRRLAEYHGSCTPGTVKTLLKTSLAAVKYVAPDTTLAGPVGKMKSDILVAQLSDSLAPPWKGASLTDDVLYKLYVGKIMLPTSDAAFVKAIQADESFKSISANFGTTDKNQIVTLQSIAELRGYAAKAQTELKKETLNGVAKQVDAATKDVAAATSNKASAVVADSAAKTDADAKLDVVKTTLPDVANRATDKSLSDTDLIKFAKKPTLTPAQKEAVANAEKAMAAKTAAEAQVKATTDTLEAKQLVLTHALNLLATLKSSAVEPRDSTPASISAILVPNN